MMYIYGICPSKQDRLKFSKEVITIGCWPQQISDLIMWEAFTFSNLDQPVTEQEFSTTELFAFWLHAHLVCKSSPAAHVEHAGLRIGGTCVVSYALDPLRTPGHTAAESSFCHCSGSRHLGSGAKALCYKSNDCTHIFRLSVLISGNVKLFKKCCFPTHIR